MKAFTLSALALAGAARLANAHATVFAIWVNGVDQGLGNSASGYIRSPPNNDPIKDVTSTSMTCNVNNAATAKTIEVKTGDKVTIEWHHNDRTASDDIIASSHHGPVMTYIAPTSSNGAGDVWLKIQEDGYTNGVWGVDNLITNKGKYDITVPKVAAGEYLIRSEIIALHEANNVGGAQFYMECVQVKVTDEGGVTLPAGVAIPGTYTAQDAGIYVNIYNSLTSYTIPGPAVWDGAGGAAAPTSSAAASSSAAPVSSEAATSAFATSAAATSAVATSAAATSAAAAETSAPAVSSIVAAPTTLMTVTKTTVATSAAAPASTSAAAPAVGGAVQHWAQCGGINYTGATGCAEGLTCRQWNPYYYQCVGADGY